MLSKKLEEALNAQINAEMWSAYLYLSMSAYAQDKGMAGMANWFEVQFKEEQDHALIFFKYIISRGGKVSLRPLAEVKTVWESPLDAFKDTLEHENEVTALINSLFTLSEEENDYATQSMLKWFIDEQVEEEDNAQKLIESLTLIDGNGFGLYMLDKELAARVYKQAAPLVSSKAT
ncbi:MAG: ferritin [Phocaeicola sp.]